MLEKNSKLNLEKIIIAWQKLMPDCGETMKRSFIDDKYNLKWVCMFNYKRMLRRAKKLTPQNDICSFCLASESNDNKLGQLNNFSIYGNRYPIEPMHCLLFNNQHKIDPSFNELVELLELAKEIPNLRILLSNRPGSGASIPSHLHVHAFVISMPIEDAGVLDSFTKKTGILEVLNYPAWTVKISSSAVHQKAKLLKSLLSGYEIPFNISFIGTDLYIIPRKNESPKICESIIDGVGSLETAGVYTATSESALKQVVLETFHKGLEQSGYIDDIKFQNKFINYCIKILEENEKNTY